MVAPSRRILSKKIFAVIRYMKSKKVSDEVINRNLHLDDGEESEPIYHQTSVDLRQKYPDHCNVHNWYFPMCGRWVG